jgi:uncharacterized lipoprotein YmbA
MNMKSLAALVLALAACFGLTGCFDFLKPVHATARQFVLTPLPATSPPAAAAGSIPVGVGQVRLAAYLFTKSLVVRRGANEIDYLPTAFWAERLGDNFQRVLAANLATLLPTDEIRLSAWRSEDVAAEVYVAVEQFDVDADGRAVLVARWRVLSPGGAKTLRSREFRHVRQGPPPEPDPAGAIATLSELVAALSEQVAQNLQEVVPVGPSK